MGTACSSSLLWFPWLPDLIRAQTIVHLNLCVTSATQPEPPAACDLVGLKPLQSRLQDDVDRKYDVGYSRTLPSWVMTSPLKKSASRCACSSIRWACIGSDRADHGVVVGETGIGAEVGSAGELLIGGVAVTFASAVTSGGGAAGGLAVGGWAAGGLAVGGWDGIGVGPAGTLAGPSPPASRVSWRGLPRALATAFSSRGSRL